MANEAESVRRDRVFVEKSQLERYREFAGLGVALHTKGRGANLPPFQDLKDVFMAAVCVGLRGARPAPLRNRQELTRTSYFTEQGQMAVLRSIAIAETGEAEVIADENRTLSIAEEYASVGFEELSHRLLGPGQPLANLAAMLAELHQLPEESVEQ